MSKIARTVEMHGWKILSEQRYKSSFVYLLTNLYIKNNSQIRAMLTSQGHNFYKLKYISLEEVKSVPFQK